jgi:hypothetical protein
MKQITQLFLSQNPLIAMLNQQYFPLISFIVLIILTYSGNVLGQTTVFTDDFNRTLFGTTGGTPTMTWTPGYLATSQGQIQTKGTAPNYSVQISSNTTTAVVGRDYLTGSLSTFSAPFTSTLKNNIGDVTWTFNMGLSDRAVSPLATAFDAGAFWGSAVILAMSGSNPTDAATNGYAVVMTQGSATGDVVFSLVKFANGLIASANLTSIIGISSNFTPRTNWRSIKVIYTASTDTWKLYVRDDAVGASGTTAPDPSSGTLTQVGSATVDNTYTSAAMSSCGLFLNHGSNAASTAWTRYDNFKVTVDEPISFTTGWPKIENVTSSGFTAKTNASISGTSYFVVLPAGATAPTTAQVKAGQDASGASLVSNLKGNIACALAATEYTTDITGLTSETTYDVYFAAENLAGNNLQAAPTKVTTTTSITTSISSLNQSIKAFVKDNKIVVLDAKGQNLLISTLSGQLINNEMLISDNQSFMLNRGLYVVRISNQRIKVWIK